MFKFTKFTRTLAPVLFTGLLLAGCMDELDDFDAELIADTALDDEELALLLDEDFGQGLEVDAEPDTCIEGDEEPGAIDEIAQPPLGPCDPPLPPRPLQAPDFDPEPEEGDEQGLSPAPFGVQAPDFDPEDEDEDEDEDPEPIDIGQPGEVEAENHWEQW